MRRNVNITIVQTLHCDIRKSAKYRVQRKNELDDSFLIATKYACHPTSSSTLYRNVKITLNIV